MTGYRKMISDRIPATWDLALRWTRCRKRFIERIYERCVMPYNNDYRSRKIRMQLASKAVKDNLNPKLTKIQDAVGLYKLFHYGPFDEYEYWRQVADLVVWFSVHVPYIQSTLSITSKTTGADEEELANIINDEYNLDDIKLAKYLVKNLC